MSDPTPRVIHETVVWSAATRSQMCMCGHPHYGREPSNNGALAPQWTWCEDLACKCRGLRPTS
jgi:hypothetical protein